MMENRKPIIIVQPKMLSLKDKNKLEKDGNIVIEHIDPESVKYVCPVIEPPAQYVYVPCASCGVRIYMLQEQLTAFRKSGLKFYCLNDHDNFYPLEKK